MKKNLCIAFLMLIMISGCSCGLFDQHIEGDEKISTNTIEKVVKAVNSKDKKTLKSLFSETVKDDSEDFDKDVDDLFAFLDGKIQSWEDPTGPGSEEEYDYGVEKRILFSRVYFTTDKNKYELFITECIVNEENPDEIGIQSMEIIYSEDASKYMELEYEEKVGIKVYNFVN